MRKLFPSDQIIETKTFDVGQDWEVPIVGFFIIAAKDKTKRSFADFDADELNEFIQLLKRVRVAMKEVLQIHDAYVWQNEDTEHSFHVWLFPRHDWMEQFGRKIDSARPIMKFAIANRATGKDIKQIKEAVQKVRAYLSKV